MESDSVAPAARKWEWRAPESFRTSENSPSFIIKQTFQVEIIKCVHRHRQKMQKVLANLGAESTQCACGGGSGADGKLMKENASK